MFIQYYGYTTESMTMFMHSTFLEMRFTGSTHVVFSIWRSGTPLKKNRAEYNNMISHVRFIGYVTGDHGP